MSTIAVGYGSASTEFKSKFPNLHMPSYPVSSVDMITPGHADALLDGEFLMRDVDGDLARPPAAAAPGPALDHINDNFACNMSHGNPGRSDHQVGEHIPWVMDDDYEIVTRLHTGNRTAGAVATVAGVFYGLNINDITLPINGGTAFVGKVILAAAAAGEPFVARCTEAEDTHGWARFYISKGSLPV